MINLYTYTLNGAKKVILKVNVGGYAMGGYMVYIEDAIASCEVLPCNDQNEATAKEDYKYDKLKKLKSLLDEGVLTQQEFDSERKKVLDEN